MSSWKKAAKMSQKTHRERHQPESRKFLGLLEKKKDYKTRALDQQDKQATLKLLRKRALNKNPDEFYFHMINSRVVNGIHREKQKADDHSLDQIQLMKTQDLKYVSSRRIMERKKIDKLQSELHIIDAANEVKNQHIFFVDDAEEEKDFDIAKRLDTHPALIGRRTNRPRLESLKKMKMPHLDESTLEKIEQKKHMSYRELDKRLERERELGVVQRKMELERALKDTKCMKPKQICSGSKYTAPIYKWKYERKR